MSDHLEGLLRPPVAQWLHSQGMNPVFEVMLGGCCDVVGVRWGVRVGKRIPAIIETHAVELKLHDVAGVIRQARWNRHGVTFSWAAMPSERFTKMRPGTLAQFEEWGIGLLEVGKDVVVRVPASRGESSGDHLAKKLWRRRGEWSQRLAVNIPLTEVQL
jgi:hypothetical protein